MGRIQKFEASPLGILSHKNMVEIPFTPFLGRGRGCIRLVLVSGPILFWDRPAFVFIVS